jgi:hypothetical protein
MTKSKLLDWIARGIAGITLIGILLGYGFLVFWQGPIVLLITAGYVSIVWAGVRVIS